MRTWDLTDRMLAVIAAPELDQHAYTEVLLDLGRSVGTSAATWCWSAVLWPAILPRTSPTTEPAGDTWSARYPRRHWPALAQTLLETAARDAIEPGSNFRSSAAMSEQVQARCGDIENQELIFEWAYVLHQVLAGAGGRARYAEIVDAHEAWLPNQHRTLAPSLGLIIASIAAGNIGPANGYLAALFGYGANLGLLAGVWMHGAAALLRNAHTVATIGPAGDLVALGVLAEVDTTTDEGAATRLIGDLVTACRSGDHAVLPALHTRINELSGPALAILVWQLACTLGIRLGQLAATADADPQGGAGGLPGSS